MRQPTTRDRATRRLRTRLVISRVRSCQPRAQAAGAVRGRLRVNRYSSRTEEQYLQWIKRSIVFHGKRHPAGMAAPEVEAVRLRVKEVEFSRHEILVRDGKGARARLTMLAGALVEPLQRHLVKVRELYEIDLREGVEAGAS